MLYDEGGRDCSSFSFPSVAESEDVVLSYDFMTYLLEVINYGATSISRGPIFHFGGPVV
jgi:hypothetical protein